MFCATKPIVLLSVVWFLYVQCTMMDTASAISAGGGGGPTPAEIRRRRSAENCQFQNDLTIDGYDIADPTPGGSSEDCCQLCEANPQCLAAVFRQLMCFLKSGGLNSTKSDPTSSLILMSGRTLPPTPEPTTPSPTTNQPSPTSPVTSPPVPPGPPPPGPPPANDFDCPAFDQYNPADNAPPLQSGTAGGGCSCAVGECKDVTPTFNWIFTLCSNNTKCGDDNSSCACSKLNQPGPSKLKLNYASAYQLKDDGNGGWVWNIVSGASLNRQGTAPLVFDSETGQNDFANLPTERDVYVNQPKKTKRIVNSPSGGGGGWDIALFPYNTTALKPPGMMFVFSGHMRGAAWFLLNQATLNRGPNTPTCRTSHNCWSTGSAGEVDFLEFPNLFGPYNNEGWDPDARRKMWFTSFNSAGRCFNQNTWKGTWCNPEGFCGANPIYGANESFYTNYFMQGAGAQYSLYNYNYDDGKEHVWVAIIDFKGMHLYRDPDFGGAITRTYSADTISQLSPTNGPMTAGACGDPNVYTDAQMADAPCVLYLPSAPVYLTKGQWDAATQLVSDRQHPRYTFPSADAMVNSWGTGASQCKNKGGEMWWNLFIDTMQPVVPPTVYGTVYTSSIESSGIVDLIVPGYNEDVSKFRSWKGVVTDDSGAAQAVVYGSVESSCIPGHGSQLTNCPYTTQSLWPDIFVRHPPQGMNINMCTAGGNLTEGNCSLELYISTLKRNQCSLPCGEADFIYSIGTLNHPGCGPTMSSCPIRGATPQCSKLGPYGDVSEGTGDQCGISGECPQSVCSLVVGPANYVVPESAP
eukprot:PhM_4_TR342/c0_g1_i1/m.20109